MRRLYLVRHAHRDTADRILDNGLTEKGREQALRIRDWFIRSGLPIPKEILSSPKARCRETLEPLALGAGSKLRVDLGLDEQRENESTGALGNRVMSWLESWIASEAETTIVCSHGDWIPILVGLCTGKRLEISKGAIVGLEFPSRASSSDDPFEPLSVEVVQKP